MQQNIFEKILKKLVAHIFSRVFGAFFVPIGQLFEAQKHFKLLKKIKMDVIFLRKQQFYSFKEIFCLHVHERSAVKNLFKTYASSKVDSCFCEAVYILIGPVHYYFF